MNQNTIVTFLFLDTIYNRKKSDFRELSEVFIPLLKNVLSSMFAEGHYQGANNTEIKEKFDNEYSIDIPYNILHILLEKIANERDSEGNKSIIYNKDSSFQLTDKFYFEDFSEQVDYQRRDLLELEQNYEKFLIIEGDYELEKNSLYSFIDQNRMSLSSYFDSQNIKSEDYSNEKYILQARFLEMIGKNSKSFDTLKKIYLGSIIASYLSTTPISINKEMEFVLDTNFLISILELSSIEEIHTCQSLISIFEQNKYQISVLHETIEETKNLLQKKARNFDNDLILSMFDKSSITYNAHRQGLKKSDLEWIAHNLPERITTLGFSIINHDFKGGELKDSEEYKYFYKVRNAEEKSALHDTLAVKYVKKKRLSKKIEYFSDANCWFVVNLPHVQKHYQKETIRAEDLLNIYWLTTPNITPTESLVEEGLTRLVSSTLSPNKSVRHFLKELNERVIQYSTGTHKDLRMNPKELYRIGEGVQNNTIKHEQITQLLQKKGKDEFINEFTRLTKVYKRDTQLKNEKYQSEVVELREHRDRESRQYEQDFERLQADSLEKQEEIKNQKDLEISALKRYNQSLIQFQEYKWDTYSEKENVYSFFSKLFNGDRIELLRKNNFKTSKIEFESKYSLEMFKSPSFEIEEIKQSEKLSTKINLIAKMKKYFPWVLVFIILFLILFFAFAKSGSKFSIEGFVSGEQGTNIESDNPINSPSTIVGYLKINNKNASPTEVRKIYLKGKPLVSPATINQNGFRLENVIVPKNKIIEIEVEMIDGKLGSNLIQLGEPSENGIYTVPEILLYFNTLPKKNTAKNFIIIHNQNIQSN